MLLNHLLMLIALTPAAAAALSPLSPRCLRTMCRAAAVSDRLRELTRTVGKAEQLGTAKPFSRLATLGPALQKDFDALDLRMLELQEMDSTQLQVVESTSEELQEEFEESESARSLQLLQVEAERLHTLVEQQQQQISLLEEQVSGGTTERAREVFDMIDINSDGTLQFQEFQEVASRLPFWSTSVSASKLNATLISLFETADTNGDGVLDFTEFLDLLSSLRADSLDPLREARIGDLGKLLNVTLQMTSRNLMTELGAHASVGSSIHSLGMLEACVERWCSLHDKAGTAIEPVRNASSAELVEQETDLEGLLAQVGGLANNLSLTNVTGTVHWSLRRSSRQFVRGVLSSLTFCWRGLQILASDVFQSLLLLNKLWQGRALEAQEVQQVKRAVVDLVAMVPYTIIMIIPLSPPGHVFAFGVLNRCFPSAIPSPFTRQRQDINEIYSTIAAEAASGTSGLRAWQRNAAISVTTTWRKFLRQLGLRRGVRKDGTAQQPMDSFAGGR